MRNMLAVAGKELRAYFHSPIAYLVMTVYTRDLRLCFLQLHGVLHGPDVPHGGDGRHGRAAHEPE